MPGRKRWVSLALTLSLLTMGVALSAGADASQENEFLSKINAERSAVGLGALSMSGSLQTYARCHSGKMAASGGIFHSSNALLTAAAGSGWTKLGENVGRGGSVSSLHDAFMASAGHKANILGAYNTVGVGTVVSGGTIYVTVVFVNYSGSPSPGSTSCSSAAATTSPATVATTTTTLPPTTTTTLIVPPDQEITPGNECIETTRFWQMCQD